MKNCLILRGHHYYDKKIGKHRTSEERMANSPQKFDFRDCFSSLKRNIIDPLNNKFDCYIATYESPIQDQFNNHINNIKEVKILSESGCSQMHTLNHAVSCIHEEYDSYIICRFDLLYKQPITNFFNENSKEGLYCTWKETQHLWNSHKRIGDALFAIKGKKSFDLFKDALRNYIVLENTEATKRAIDGEEYYPSRSAHYFYPFLEEKNVKINFLVDGFFDTNTSFPNLYCNNPIYVMYGRNYFFGSIEEFL